MAMLWCWLTFTGGLLVGYMLAALIASGHDEGRRCPHCGKPI